MNTHLIIIFLAAVVSVACALAWPSVLASVPASGRGLASRVRLNGWAVVVPRALPAGFYPTSLVGAPTFLQPASAGMPAPGAASAASRASQIPSRLQPPSSVRVAFRQIL